MMAELLSVLKHALMITGFVFVMMLVIEYVNVQTKGLWQKGISENKWKQYLFAALLGAIPGCLGSFTAVALYSHRLISFGAIVTTMIATSGDEAFVMLAMFPGKAILLTGIIFVIGIIAGFIADRFSFLKNSNSKLTENKFPLHDEEKCNCFNPALILKELKNASFRRIVLIIIVALFLLSVVTGVIAGGAKTWVKVTIIIVVSFSLFVVATVPEHFLKEHLWEHIVKVHLLRIFLWTFGTLLVVHFLMNYIDLETIIKTNMLWVLLIAVLVGVIPESGPHLIFVTLFASGSIPFSILLASSISQDGHGMIPLLAESKKSFIYVKLVNIIVALFVGGIGYILNF